MEAPLGVGARGRAEAPDSRGRGRGAGGRARKPGWEAGAGAPGAAKAGAGTQPGRFSGHRPGGLYRAAGETRGRRRASAGNAGVTGLLPGKTPEIWAAPTRHTRADRAGVPGKDRRDKGQKPGFPGRVPGPWAGKSRFPGGKNPVFQVIVPGV